MIVIATTDCNDVSFLLLEDDWKPNTLSHDSSQSRKICFFINEQFSSFSSSVEIIGINEGPLLWLVVKETLGAREKTLFALPGKDEITVGRKDLDVDKTSLYSEEIASFGFGEGVFLG